MINMLNMEILQNVLLIVLPSLIAGTAVYLLIRHYHRVSLLQQSDLLKTERLKLVTPVRLQAYERMVLLLERMMTSQLIMRNMDSGPLASQLQQALVANIRQEFDHNLSQQLYISSNAWELIKNAREAVIAEINAKASSLDATATSSDLARLLFHGEIEESNITLYKALEYLKNEARELF